MVSVAIQAGGLSRRIGRDKSLLSFNGIPLISHVVHRVSFLSDELFVITNKPEQYFFLNLPLVADLFPGTGVIGGVYTAFEVASNPFVAVFACDMPFINSELLKIEIQTIERTACDVVIPDSPLGLQPLHAIYNRQTCLPKIFQAIKIGERKLISWFSDLSVIEISKDVVEKIDPEFRTFVNFNTLNDFNHYQ